MASDNRHHDGYERTELESMAVLAHFRGDWRTERWALDQIHLIDLAERGAESDG